MAIKTAHSFLVHPGKHAETQPEIYGTKIELSGKLFKVLEDIYEKSESECDIDISFNPNEKGEQQNNCRDQIISYIKSPSDEKGLILAKNLQKVTTKRSGLGLFFLMTGVIDSYHRLVLSRFPADSGILADQKAGSLTVEFLERIFMKSATSYKSVLYKGSSFDSDFWDGKAIDRQINSDQIEISDYWIKEFLLSDFKTTSAAGTRRLANLLKEVANNTNNFEVKEQIAAAARLSKGFDGKQTSIAGFVNHLNLSEDVKKEMRDALPAQTLFAEKFKFDVEEFKKHISYESIELSSGGILTAEASEFEEVFKKVSISKDIVRYTAEGKIINQRLKKGK